MFCVLCATCMWLSACNKRRYMIITFLCLFPNSHVMFFLLSRIVQQKCNIMNVGFSSIKKNNNNKKNVSVSSRQELCCSHLKWLTLLTPFIIALLHWCDRRWRRGRKWQPEPAVTSPKRSSESHSCHYSLWDWCTFMSIYERTYFPSLYINKSHLKTFHLPLIGKWQAN